MRLRYALALIVILLGFAMPGHAQLWSGILKPTSGTGACTFGVITLASQCAVDWTQVGIPGGIPTNWTQSGSTIQASACGNGSSDCTSTIQTALTACAGSSLPGHFVQLGSGTFLIDGSLSIPNYCYLNGNGPQSTIVNCMATSGSCIHMGSVNDAPYKNGSTSITAGATAGSTSLTLSSTALDSNNVGSALAAGGYLLISELSDPVYVTQASPENPGGCSYCDAIFGGTRLREQVVEMESVSGSGPYNVSISPPLYTNYGVASGTSPAYATPFGFYNGGKPDCKYCGAEDFQIYANGTGLSSGMSDMNMTVCAYCWSRNVEFNYSDGDWLDMAYCYRCEVRDNYFSNGFGHGAGSTDNDVQLYEESSASLLINNIMERGHTSIIVDLGAAGNVIAYNYTTGNFDAVGIGADIYDLDQHGAYPQFNLWEGNVSTTFAPDSWHGNEGYNTVFRNWLQGTTTVATYPVQAIKSISCSGGTCTITWVNPPSTFYAGAYINIWGTNVFGCGSGSGMALGGSANFQMTGSAGSLSNTFSAGNCTSATGGYAATLDLSRYPTPITHLPIQWSSGTYSTYQAAWPFALPAFTVGNNLIGNVLGSTQMSTTAGGSAYFYKSGPAACTSCMLYPTSRPYPVNGPSLGGGAVMSNFNYDVLGDASSPGWTTLPGGPSSTAGYWLNQGFTTTFYHGNYDMASASTIWNVNASGSQTLPASFFLSSKPNWFGKVAWPPIGPDVSGGPDSAVAGHTNYIPAEVCYNNTPKDSTGVLQFDANNCYPVPPTAVNAVGH